MSGFDQESIVYGHIREIPPSETNENLLRSRINRSVILSLPRSFDDEWPYFCSPMFAMPGKDTLEGSYHSRLIYFAASYRAIEQCWAHWLEQFESLLNRMYWTSAVVHLETETRGKHVFHWAAEGATHLPGNSKVSRVACEWERELAFS